MKYFLIIFKSLKVEHDGDKGRSWFFVGDLGDRQKLLLLPESEMKYFLIFFKSMKVEHDGDKGRRWFL